MTVSLSKILTCYGITDILKETFLKTYKPPPGRPGTAASLLYFIKFG